MTRTLEHIVDMRQVASERRASGKPVWDGTLRLKQYLNGAVNGPAFTAARDALVAAVQASAWFLTQPEWSDLRMLVEELAAAPNAEDFDGWLDELYDKADADRIWIT